MLGTLFERIIAFRYLRSAKKQGFVSVIAGFSFLGITLGVATLVVVTSIMNGFHDELLDKLTGTRGHIFIQGQTPSFIEDKTQLEQWQALPEIDIITPIIERQAIAIIPEQTRGIIINATEPENIRSRDFLKDKLVSGSFDEINKPDHLYIGARFAESAYLKVGDKIKLYAPDGVTTPFGTLPKQKTFTIAGIFEVGMYDFDKNVVLMSLRNAQRFFSLSNKINLYEVFLKDIDTTTAVTQKLRKMSPYYHIINWQQSDSKVFQAVQIEKNVMFLILSIVVVIAIFNIVSGLIMLVKDKTRDVAILRTFGASRKNILSIFFITGSSIGIIGTLLGIGLGLLFAINIESVRQFLQYLMQVELFSQEVYFLSQLPCQVNTKEIIFIGLMSCSFSCLASLYPALKASKLDPVEALRL